MCAARRETGTMSATQSVFLASVAATALTTLNFAWMAVSPMGPSDNVFRKFQRAFAIPPRAMRAVYLALGLLAVLSVLGAASLVSACQTD